MKFVGLVRDFLKMDKKALAKFINFFYAKTTLKLSVAMPNSRLHTNFQLNIFIFEARVSLQTLLQSLKQNSDFLRQIFKLFRLKKYEKTSEK